jgi:hypothetical protein
MFFECTIELKKKIYSLNDAKVKTGLSDGLVIEVLDGVTEADKIKGEAK